MLGDDDFEEYGVALFMSDEIIQRLIDCFHYHKLLTVESIRRETHWRRDLTNTYGPSILSLVHQFDPPPSLSGILDTQQSSSVSSLPPAMSSSSNVQTNASSHTKSGKARVCSACKQPGHNSEFLM